MGSLPFLSPSFRRRFEPSPEGALKEGDGFPPESPLMAILTPAKMWIVNNLSPVAKMDKLGRPVEEWNYELPPMEVTQLLLRPIALEGLKPNTEDRPFALRAIGPVDANRIRRGGKGLVSDKFTIIP